MSATSDLPVSDSAVQIDAGKGAPSSPPRDGNSVPQPRNSKPARLHLAPLLKFQCYELVARPGSVPLIEDADMREACKDESVQRSGSGGAYLDGA